MFTLGRPRSLDLDFGSIQLCSIGRDYKVSSLHRSSSQSHDKDEDHDDVGKDIETDSTKLNSKVI